VIDDCAIGQFELVNSNASIINSAIVNESPDHQSSIIN